MNLTEPQAGSDLSAVRTTRRSAGRRHYRVHGQKIFITYGEHDLTENIVHLVLARTPDAPEGVKGISLFVVPKFLVNDDGSARRAQRRALRVDRAQARHPRQPDRGAGVRRRRRRDRLPGRRGEPRPGDMFIMMNAARFASALEGIGARRARVPAGAGLCARARAGQGSTSRRRQPQQCAIIRHPDVRRMLMQMKSRTEAMRALAYVVAATIDPAHRHPDAEGARAGPGLRRPDDPGREGLVHRDRHRRRVDRRAGPRRHGLHRGNRRGAAPARCAHHHDLRRHDRHPGERPGRPQDRCAKAAARCMR